MEAVSLCWGDQEDEREADRGHSEAGDQSDEVRLLQTCGGVQVGRGVTNTSHLTPHNDCRSQSRAVQEELHQERCSQSKIFQSQSEFQNCSHEAVTLVYHEIHEQSEEAISKKLCKTLAVIANVCPQHLRNCFETYDLLQMRWIHVKQMIKFLKRIFSKRFSNMNFIDNCELKNEELGGILPVTEASREPGSTYDWQEDIHNSITEKIIPGLNDDDLTYISVQDDPSLTEEIDRNTPTQAEEESSKQKVILEYEVNDNQDNTEHYDSNNLLRELGKNNCYIYRPNFLLLIFLITRHYAF